MGGFYEKREGGFYEKKGRAEVALTPLSLKMKRKNNQMCTENWTAKKLLDDIWAVWVFFWLCDECLFSWLFPKPEKGLLAKMSQCILFSIFSLCSKGRLTLHPALVHHYENNNSKAQRKVGRKGTVWSWLKLPDWLLFCRRCRLWVGKKWRRLEDGCDITSKWTLLGNHDKDIWPISHSHVMLWKVILGIIFRN